MPSLIPDVTRHLETTGPKPKLLHPRLLLLAPIAAIGNRHAAGHHMRIDIAGTTAANYQKPVVTVALASTALRIIIRDELLQRMLRQPAAGPFLPRPLACLRQFRRIDAFEPHALAIKNEAVAINRAEGALMLDVGPVVQLGGN